MLLITLETVISQLLVYRNNQLCSFEKVPKSSSLYLMCQYLIKGLLSLLKTGRAACVKMPSLLKLFICFIEVEKCNNVTRLASVFAPRWLSELWTLTQQWVTLHKLVDCLPLLSQNYSQFVQICDLITCRTKVLSRFQAKCFLNCPNF